MHRPLLVLVRWHGDIVATYDALPRIAPVDSGCDGVCVEVYDVAAERAALRLRPAVDLRPIAGFAVSAVLHALVAIGVFLMLTSKGEDQIKADQMNQQGATLADYVTRIAANENAAEKPKDERAPAAVVEEQAKPEPAPTRESAPSDVVAHGSAGKDTVSTSPSICAPPKGGKGHGPKCQRAVVITGISTRPSCFVDTVAKSGDTGILTFPCDGDGEATLTFGTRSFAGADVGGKVNVCTGTEYPWSDGCTWTSAQRVTGSIASGTLSFTYGEAPRPGQNNCARACEAHGTVRVQGESWRDTN
jgi:hypothetical protein